MLSNQFFDEVGAHQLLSREEEIKLAQRAKSGDKLAREKMILCNLRLAVKIANEFHSKSNCSLEDLIQEHGMQQNYSRSVIRNYFYSKFDSPELGLNKFNNFKHTGKTLQFPFRAFFDLEQLYFHLNQCAFFLNMNFYPSDKTCQIWKEFIDRNQGFQSQKRCQIAMNHILNNTSMYIGDFNLAEEAWILYKLSTIFRCYNHSLLDVDHLPNDTKIISKIIYEWKYNDRNTT
jgi:hypothetical protein